jgi:GNAT superfamily N-acetyltransferase
MSSGLIGGAYARAYTPTLRDRAAMAMMGRASPNSLWGQLVGGLVGSNGVGGIGRGPFGTNGLVDMTPLGLAFQADEGGRQVASGHPFAGALSVASALPLPVGKAAQVAKGLFGGARQAAEKAAETRALSEIVDRAEQSGVKLSVQNGRNLNVSQIVVPKDARNQGVGTQILNDLTGYADTINKQMTLTPDASFGGSVSRLNDFYKRFGFVPNKGRTKDYAISEAMYRVPQTPAVQNGLSLPDGASAPLDVSHAARMQRAADQGFNTAKPYYHGSPAEIPQIDASLGGGNYGQGFYTTRMKDQAANYAGPTGAVYPTFLRGDSLDLTTPAGRAAMDTLTHAQRQQQYDLIRAPGETVALNNRAVRSVFDGFNPGGEARVGVPMDRDFHTSSLAPPEMQSPPTPATSGGSAIGSSLPASDALFLPPPDPAAAKTLAQRMDVPLDRAFATQGQRQWNRYHAGDTTPMFPGLEDLPVAVRREDNTYHLFDGHHRADLALQSGQTSMPMHVINAKDYAPEAAGRAPRPDSGPSIDELLAALGVDPQSGAAE